MKKPVFIIFFLLFVGLILSLSIWGPEALAEYQDKFVLEKTHAEEITAAGEGYRYTLNSNERLSILSECLNSRILPESDFNARTRNQTSELEYQELAGTYAFVINPRGPSGKEITDEQIYETCNRELETLKELGILPEEVKTVEKETYEAVLYSAIDVLEPRNHVAVWEMTLSNSQKNYHKENRVLDVYLDADSGKIYEFYARTELAWEDVAPDEIIEKWRVYMGLGTPEPYETANPLLETTPFFKKYVFAGMGEEKTVVTIGFYEGIRELFLKITG